MQRYYNEYLFSMYLVLARTYSMKCLESFRGVPFILEEKSIEKIADSLLLEEQKGTSNG